MQRWILAGLFAVAGGTPLWGLEHVSFRRDDVPHHISGSLLVEAQDGGLLLLDSEGVLWSVQPEEVIERTADSAPLKMLDREALSERLQKQFPDGFRLHSTAHYLICHNTSRAYAQWCGALYERLYTAFHTFWKHQGFQLQEPAVPLVALVFDNSRSYAAYARDELGRATESIEGYFSLRTNRVTMYDLTSTDPVRSGAATTAAHVNRLLMRPDGARTVATIIHEATHQLAFNCGLHQRYADVPRWVSEGTAVYFETPDLKSTRGWRGIGAVHRARLIQFRRYLRERPRDSLRTLLASDDRFLQVRLATDAYAEAWALNYYLLKNRSDEYVAYLKLLARKDPLIYDTAEERIALFQRCFRQPLAQFDADFLRYMSRVR